MELLLIPLIAAAALLPPVTVLWLRDRRRVRSLEAELARERARQRRAPRALTPLKAVLEGAARVRDEGLGEVLRSSVEDLLASAADAEPELRQLAGSDGTLTIFFSDIENSTALNEELGDKTWLKVLGGHDRIVRKRTGDAGGYVIKSQGDGFMIAFGGAADGIRAAVGIQRDLADAPRGLRGVPIAVRIGLHTGPALERDGDLFGRNVALAARVAAQAHAGEILVTDDVRDAAAGTDDLAFTDPREVELKGLPGPHTVFAVRWS